MDRAQASDHHDGTLEEEEIERTTLVLVRFPALDYFANVHIGERTLGSVADAAKEDNVTKNPRRKRQRAHSSSTAASVKKESAEDGGRLCGSLDQQMYMFDPTSCLSFVGDSLTSEAPQLCVTSGEDCQVFTGTWTSPGGGALKHPDQSRSNVVIVQLKRDAGKEEQAAAEVTGPRPASLLAHPPEGLTSDEVYVKPRTRGSQRKAMLEVTPAGQTKVAKWHYSDVIVPDAILDMRRVA